MYTLNGRGPVKEQCYDKIRKMEKLESKLVVALQERKRRKEGQKYDHVCVMHPSQLEGIKMPHPSFL